MSEDPVPYTVAPPALLCPHCGHVGQPKVAMGNSVHVLKAMCRARGKTIKQVPRAVLRKPGGTDAA
jgi:hypothetical protein